jgi:peptidoglycan/LPS O-acetylase OafA/YrhL
VVSIVENHNKQAFWKIEGRVSNHLDMLRGLLAIIVMIGHERNLFFVDYPSVTNLNLLIKTLYFITGFAYQAIIGFLVLSGLLISLSIMRSLQDGKWSWKYYLTARLSRLLVVLIPALVIGAFWDQLGMWMFGMGGIYGANPSLNGHIVTVPVDQRSSLLIGIGNALFLQEIIVPVFGSNGPLWVLSNWFWYYILFPLGLSIYLPNISKAMKVGAVLVCLLIFYIVGSSISLYFVIWLVGATVTFIPPWKNLLISSGMQRFAIIFGFSLLISCLFGIKAKIVGIGFKSDLILALVLGLVVYIILHGERIQLSRDRNIYKTVSRLLAGFSYTLYLVHVPFLVFLQSATMTVSRWQPDASHLALAAILFILVLVYAFLISRLTENKSDVVRRFVLTRIG